MPDKHIDRDDESRRILDCYGAELSSLRPIMEMLERQFGVLHNRAQVLLGLCGVVISTTGFSGRLIAGTNRLAQVLIIGGVALILFAAAVVCWGVLHLRWLTMQQGQTVPEWLATTLRYRDVKTNSYRVGVVLMLVGLTLYAAAIAVMLTHPHQGELPAR